jgi:outer membrane protein assembly factor BamD (BamD/ComL family)
LAAILCLVLQSAHAQKPQQKPTGAFATSVRDVTLYVGADDSTQKLATIGAGREMVIAEHNGEWLRVFANTDNEQESDDSAPVFTEDAPPPISGWMRDKGIVQASTLRGDEALFGVAANFEEQASESNSNRGAAQTARLLYQRVASIFPQSPRAPEAEWRAADIRWQLEKVDVFSRPSAHEKENYLRQQIDETELKKLQKKFPHSRWADLAAYDMLDNKVCGDWQGSTKCPEKESDMYLKYVEEHPDSPKASEAMYKAIWRQSSLKDMYSADNDEKKSEQAGARAKELEGRLVTKYPQSDYAARAAGLIYKLEQSIPIYGSDHE